MRTELQFIYWAVPLLWIVFILAITVLYRRDIHRLWREPTLRFPVLVVESDDWGAGPLVQASALDDMAAVLQRYRDSSGRTPVLSVAVVLAVPDGSAIGADGSTYRRIFLDHPRLVPVLQALKRGEAEGTLSLQLHGLEHFWPETLMASDDTAVQAWLRESALASTEQLPPHLQSRWIDATLLPSRELAEDAIHRAAAEEVEVFGRVFGRPPKIVVPPTFVWTDVVERAWVVNGIECVVTPSRRYTGRAADGSNVGDMHRYANGDQCGGVTYLVRYDYFEPARGRDAEYALRAFRRASSEGRPCVLENHRINFCREADVRARSLQELEKLLSDALKQTPTVRFLSSSDLFHILKSPNPQWIRVGFRERFPYFLQRLRHTGRLWKLMRWCGLAALGAVASRQFCVSPATTPGSMRA